MKPRRRCIGFNRRNLLSTVVLACSGYWKRIFAFEQRYPISLIGPKRPYTTAAPMPASRGEQTGSAWRLRSQSGSTNTNSAEPRLGTGISGVNRRTTRLPISLEPTGMATYCLPPAIG